MNHGKFFLSESVQNRDLYVLEVGEHKYGIAAFFESVIAEFLGVFFKKSFTN